MGNAGAAGGVVPPLAPLVLVLLAAPAPTPDHPDVAPLPKAGAGFVVVEVVVDAAVPVLPCTNE